MKNNITSIGSLYTITEFLLPNKDRLEVRVGLGEMNTVANQITYYKYYLYLKPYKHTYFKMVGGEQSGRAELYKDYISKQQLYEALHNHWQSLNPLKMFSTYELNGEMVKFSVEKLENDNPIMGRKHTTSKVKL